MILGLCPPLVLAACLLGQEPVSGAGDGFVWTAPPGLVSLAEELAPELSLEFAEARAWTGLPANPDPFRLAWVADRHALEKALGQPAPDWFAAVAIPAERRLVIATEISGSMAALRRTTRHELMHLAMADLGPEAFDRIPAWFHEGCAELFAGEVVLGGMGTNLTWSALVHNLPPLTQFAESFPADSLGAAEGYALGHAFVERLVRKQGLVSVRDILTAVHQGARFEEAVLVATGVSTVTLEEELRQELAGLAGVVGDWRLQLFLGVAVFILLVFPLVRAKRRQRLREWEVYWAQEDDIREESPE